jgi:hypothetical protein
LEKLYPPPARAAARKLHHLTPINVVGDKAGWNGPPVKFIERDDMFDAWLQKNASPTRAAAEKWRETRPKHLVVCATGNGRPAIWRVVRCGVFDPYYEVSAGGAQRIAALASIIAR